MAADEHSDDEPPWALDSEMESRARYGDFYEQAWERLSAFEERAYGAFPQLNEPAFRQSGGPHVRLLCPSHGGTIETVTLQLDLEGHLTLLRVPRRGRELQRLTAADPLRDGSHVEVTCKMRRCHYSASHRVERLIALYLAACQRGTESITLPS